MPVALANLKPVEVPDQRQGEEIERVAVFGISEDHRRGPRNGVQRDAYVFAARRPNGESRAHDTEELSYEPPGAGAVDFFGVRVSRGALIKTWKPDDFAEHWADGCGFGW
ncbi:MAG: hypothetical protein JO151_12745 [Verrucomicrobia bacterium]|nr:hypothetical protein [Verrucomicrobiota bacterium]